MMRFNARDWYWIVGGDDSRAFSSGRNQYVSATDPAYLAWKEAQMSANGGIDPTTRIDTEANLAAVLMPYGVTAIFT